MTSAEVAPSQPHATYPDHIAGARYIGQAIGLSRGQTMFLIRTGAIPTVLIGGMRYAKRTDVERYLASQTDSDSWDDDGGPPGPERIAKQTWTEASWRRRRRGGERP